MTLGRAPDDVGQRQHSQLRRALEAAEARLGHALVHRLAEQRFLGGVERFLQWLQRFEHLAVLKQDWLPAGKGMYQAGPEYIIKVQHQFRPEYQTEPGLLDVRVRQAMAYALDRQALEEALFHGEADVPDLWNIHQWEFQ